MVRESLFLVWSTDQSTVVLNIQSSVEHLQKLFDKFVQKVLDIRRKNCKELIPSSELNSVASLCILFDTLATEENGVRYKSNSDNIDTICYSP